MVDWLAPIASALLTGAATYGALRVELRWMWAEVTRAHTEIRDARDEIKDLRRQLEQLRGAGGAGRLVA